MFRDYFFSYQGDLIEKFYFDLNGFVPKTKGFLEQSVKLKVETVSKLKRILWTTNIVHTRNIQCYRLTVSLVNYRHLEYVSFASYRSEPSAHDRAFIDFT